MEAAATDASFASANAFSRIAATSAATARCASARAIVADAHTPTSTDPHRIPASAAARLAATTAMAACTNCAHSQRPPPH